MRVRKILVSAETYDATVARACLKAGANILNLTGTKVGSDLFRLIADHDAAAILCYVQGKNVREVGDFDLRGDPIEKMREYFARQIEVATSNGVGKIFIDPGLGFYYRNLQDSAVRVRHQMDIFLNTFRLRQLGFPVATPCRTPLNISAKKSAAPSRSSPCSPRWVKRICSAPTKCRASKPCWTR